MSSNFVGVTFAAQSVTPIDDALIRRAILPDGVLAGCEISYSGTTLTMAAGHLLACGREFRHISAENWAVVDATSGYARLLLTIDLSRTSTKEAFEQIHATVEYAATLDGFSSLIQDDVNNTGSIYQVVACVVSLSNAGITGVVSTLKAASVETLLEPYSNRLQAELLWENAKPTSIFSSQTIPLALPEGATIEVIAAMTTGNPDRMVSGKCNVGESMELTCALKRNNGREVYAKTHGVVFATAYEYPDYDGTTAEANNRLIPVRIYLIKGVNV